MPQNANRSASGYIPSDTLVNYMKQKLQVEKAKRNPENAAQDFSTKARKNIRNLDRMKVHVLNKFIFQSMANLTFFLEFIAENPELEGLFEDDIKELFDMRGRGKSINVFRRLMEAIFSWDEKEDPNNFRLGLMHIIQNIIFQKINYLALNDFGDAVSNNIVHSDMGRAWAWTKLYAKRVEKDPEDPDRPVKF